MLFLSNFILKNNSTFHIMATRRTKTKLRAEPYRTCPLGPRNLKVHPASSGPPSTHNIETKSYSSGSGMIFVKKYGQHMLKNPGVLDKIIKAAEIRPTDTVLEIGPGTGNWTVRLVTLAKKVVAIDVDARMISEVKNRCFQLGYTNLEVIEADALRTTFPKFDICMANLPFQISSPFIFKLLSHRPLFRYLFHYYYFALESAILVFQKEFAERLLASTNDDKYGRLAINTRLFCTVTRICKVSAGSFNPPPKVESMVVKIVPREQPLVVDFGEWDGMIRICFSRKRRTLRSLFKKQSVLSILESNYKSWCTINNKVPVVKPFKEFVIEILEGSGLAERRSITVSIAEFLKLLLAFNEVGIHFCNIANPSKKDLMPNFLFEDDVEMEVDD
ncbi:ribosomal RNA small subunit methyltransferase A [Theileria parva strain Muguga]|uniref:rRNA adenine N(6)-methyltransferase n=1 Tax=Theileria parva TaxID=5875 RepID=Q4N282_THEPA|nr:ribosomal RNA small subunit methyltransferase A [Theileria parva strain Muguga]EAN31827.1 ribosomal RNA small subunit methyltransferase A [Theileria parva strain Muguga]|eukprot:XP_764110.1 dimethyladenosine transferase [Theileria parva strain Muguga]